MLCKRRENHTNGKCSARGAKKNSEACADWSVSDLVSVLLFLLAGWVAGWLARITLACATGFKKTLKVDPARGTNQVHMLHSLRKCLKNKAIEGDKPSSHAPLAQKRPQNKPNEGNKPSSV